MTYLYRICHQSGRVLFTTDNEVTARNREQFGWKVIEVDKSREQFEAEVFRRAEISGYKHPLSVLKKTSDGGYATTWVDMMWEGWQASRAAIEIELPDSTEFDGPDMSGAQQAISQIRKKLTETGIKVKS